MGTRRFQYAGESGRISCEAVVGDGMGDETADERVMFVMFAKQGLRRQTPALAAVGQLDEKLPDELVVEDELSM